MQTWSLGSVTITRVEEQIGFAHMPPERYFRGFDRELFNRHLSWLAPNHYDPITDRVVSSVHSWIIRAGATTILLDACAGNHKPRSWTPRFNQLDTPYLARLRAAGCSPEDIDIVLCTHLHADHVGWNTMLRDGRWVPTFPNAKYLFSKTDDAYWDPGRNAAMVSDPRSAVYTDSILPVVQAGQATLVEDGYRLSSQLAVFATPGHTPGHVSLKFEDAHARAIFCGDVIHHPIQIYAPHWNHMADERPEVAGPTRHDLLGACAETGALLFPTHFGSPHVVRITGVAGVGFAGEFIPPIGT